MLILKKKILLSLLVLLTVINVYPQATVEDMGFVSSRDKIEFNLPQFGVSISLPPMMGFRVPVSSGSNISYEISDQTYYCLDLDYLNNSRTRTFKFADSKNEKAPLYFTISPYDKALSNFAKNHPNEDIKVYYLSLHKDGKAIPSIKSSFGESASCKVSSANALFDAHHFFQDGYLFTFMMNERVDDKQRKIYESIIKGFNKKDLSQEKRKYERRVESGYFRKGKRDKIEIEGDKKFQKFEDETSIKTTFSTPHTRITIDIPENWEYEINAKGIKELSADKIEIEVDDVDLFNEKMIFNFFKAKDYTIILRFCTDKSFDIAESLKAQAKMVNYSKWEKTSIDNVPANIVFYGSESEGTVDFYLEAEKGSLWGSIYGYNLKNQEEIDQIIGSIKIEKQNKTNSKKETRPISSLFKLKETVLAELDDIELESPDLDNACEMNIKDLDLEFYLPDETSDYRTIKDRQIVPIPSNGIFKNLNISKDEAFSFMDIPMNLSVTIRANKTREEEDVESLAKAMKTAWQSYTHISNVKVSVVEYNNIIWSVIIYQQGDTYTAFANTQIDNYSVYFNLTNIGSLPQIYEKLSYLKTFKIEK